MAEDGNIELLRFDINPRGFAYRGSDRDFGALLGVLIAEAAHVGQHMTDPPSPDRVGITLREAEVEGGRVLVAANCTYSIGTRILEIIEIFAAYDPSTGSTLPLAGTNVIPVRDSMRE